VHPEVIWFPSPSRYWLARRHLPKSLDAPNAPAHGSTPLDPEPLTLPEPQLRFWKGLRASQKTHGSSQFAFYSRLSLLEGWRSSRLRYVVCASDATSGAARVRLVEDSVQLALIAALKPMKLLAGWRTCTEVTRKLKFYPRVRLRNTRRAGAIINLRSEKPYDCASVPSYVRYSRS